MLTSLEKSQIRRYLGYSHGFRDLSSSLESQMAGIDDDGETLVRQTLGSLIALDTKLTDALENLTLTKAEAVNFRGPEEIEALKTHGRSLIQRISITFDIPVVRDYYGEPDQGEGSGGMGGSFVVG